MIGSDYTGSYKSKNTWSRQPPPRLVFVAIYRYVNLKSFLKLLLSNIGTAKHVSLVISITWRLSLSFLHRLSLIIVITWCLSLSFLHRLALVIVVTWCLPLSLVHRLSLVIVITWRLSLSLVHHLYLVFVVTWRLSLSFLQGLSLVIVSYIVTVSFLLYKDGDGTRQAFVYSNNNFNCSSHPCISNANWSPR
jgi:hypothetical protein